MFLKNSEFSSSKTYEIFFRTPSNNNLIAFFNGLKEEKDTEHAKQLLTQIDSRSQKSMILLAVQEKLNLEYIQQFFIFANNFDNKVRENAELQLKNDNQYLPLNIQEQSVDSQTMLTMLVSVTEKGLNALMQAARFHPDVVEPLLVPFQVNFDG